MANYPIVCANYDVTGTVLEGLVKEYTIIQRNGIKIEFLVWERNWKDWLLPNVMGM